MLLSRALAVPQTLYLGNFTATNAGFLNVASFPAPAGPTLVISAFTGNPFASDAVEAVFSIDAAVSNATRIGGGRWPASALPTTLTTNITWPNEALYLDAAAAGWDTGASSSSPALLVAGGFLVPPKTVGAVTLALFGSSPPSPSSDTDTDTATATASPSISRLARLSVDDGNAILGGYFYHRALLHDVDGDGHLDVIAARAIKPLFGATNGQLVWMQRPPSAADPLDPSQLPWKEGILTNGSWSPDVLFALTSIRGGGDPDEQLFFASFFTGGGLGMVECYGCAAAGSGAGAAKNTWSNAAALNTTVLDASIGPSFDVQVVDLNGDGRLDLLVTNHVDNATETGGVPASGVFAYEYPSTTPLSDASGWVKHTLASGFAVREFGPNQAAPGAFRAFYPCAASTEEGEDEDEDEEGRRRSGSRSRGTTKPWVILAGDGDQRAYILRPTSDSDPADWAYEMEEVVDCKGTVGQPALLEEAAAAGGGDATCASALFVPCYDSSVVHAWAFV